MKQEQLERTIGLIGIEALGKIQNSCILICGLGGVGGTALECLARSGVEHFLLIDFDRVAASNLNRQIIYTQNDIGRYKTDVARERLFSINNGVNIDTINDKIDSNIQEKLQDFRIDYIVDAIDDINGKVALAKYAIINHIPIIVSLGMANRLDPSKVGITRLDKTTGDPLARKLRYEYRKAGIDTKAIQVTYSSELPFKDGTRLNSMMMVPSSSGLAIAYKIISDLIK